MDDERLRAAQRALEHAAAVYGVSIEEMTDRQRDVLHRSSDYNQFLFDEAWTRLRDAVMESAPARLIERHTYLVLCLAVAALIAVVVVGQATAR